MKNAKELILGFNKRGAEYTVYTDIAYGRGINGVGYECYSTYEETYNDTRAVTSRTTRVFEPKDDYLIIHQSINFEQFSWMKEAKEPQYRNIYLDYDRITRISEKIK